MTANAAIAERRLAKLGIALPEPPTPLGAYVESTDAGNLLFLSGILPIVDGELDEALRCRQGRAHCLGMSPQEYVPVRSSVSSHPPIG